MADFGIRYSQRAQLKIYNRIVPSCLALPERERLVLLFVLQRTVGWRKAWDLIYAKEFEIGAFRKNAGKKSMIVPGTGLPPDQVTQAIASLQAMGAVEAHGYGSRTAYRIVEDWCHPELPQGSNYEIWKVNESEYIYSERVNDED